MLGGKADTAGQVEGVNDFAIDVELQLFCGCIADPNGRRALVAFKPRDLVFSKPTLAGDAIHRLQIVRIARHSPYQPFSPRSGLVVKPCGQQSIERERGVAQPAETVVPVARTPGLFRKRCGRGGDDAPGLPMCQRLEGQQ